MPSPFVLVTEDGIKLSLIERPPTLILEDMIAGHHRQLGRTIADKAGGNLKGGRVAPEVVQKLLNSKKLMPIEKGCMMSMVAEGLWTQSRLVEKGYVVDILCKLCREAPDT
eukprot:8502239-Heterocapsa_arctica.AAC.1